MSKPHAPSDRPRLVRRPVIDKSKREDGTFSREELTFDKERDIYTCPAGKILTTTRKVVNDGQLLDRASKLDCDVCPFKVRCCPKEPASKITRSIHEDARDVARALGKTVAFEQSRHDRKSVEMLFAHLKRILRLGASGCAAHLACKTSSPSPPSHRTCADSPSWWPGRPRQPSRASREPRVRHLTARASKPPLRRGERHQRLASAGPRPPFADFCNKIGPSQTFCNVGSCGAVGGKADIECAGSS